MHRDTQPAAQGASNKPEIPSVMKRCKGHRYLDFLRLTEDWLRHYRDLPSTFKSPVSTDWVSGFVRCTAPALFHVPIREVRHAGAAVRTDSDADVVYYLNRTRLPVIGNESPRAQLSELTNPPHRPI